MTTVAVIDYDMGNLHSVCKALEQAGVKPIISDRASEILAADGIILPGVGAFDPAVKHIRARQLEQPIREAIANHKPFLGICLGLQILFEASLEGKEPGLGIIKGQVCRFQSEPEIRIPHMGWNQLQLTQPHLPLWQNLSPQSYVYFVHSYYVDPVDPEITAATVTHGTQTVTAAIARDNLIAVQFHPEKSGDVGLKILSSFVSLVQHQPALK